MIRVNLSAWRARLPILKAILAHEAIVNDVAFSPDGRLFATAVR